MKNFRNKNAILLTLLVVLPTFMLFGTITTNVNAFTPVPEPHPNNSWGWDVNIGDILWFELEVVERNSTTGEIIHMFRFFTGLNITSIDTAFVDVTGLGIFNLSRVNVTEVWLNPSSGMLETGGAGGTVAYFGYNDSISSELCVAGDFGIGPMILPLNATAGLDLEYLQDILKTSYFDPLAADGLYNSFDNYSADNVERNIFFENTTDGYFIDATYFPNGTVSEAEMFFLQKTWTGDYVEMYQKVKRVFDPNIASEVDWGVDLGDTLYFGENNNYEFNEKKFEITGFNLTTYWGYWSFDPESTTPMVYEDVLADLSIWNSTTEQYDLYMTNVTLGTANNLYPSLPWQADVYPPTTPFIFDTNATIEDYLFMENNFTCKRYVNFDEVHLKMDGKFLLFDMFNITSKMFVKGIFDSSRGVLNFIHMGGGMTGSDFGAVIFEKNMTVVSSGQNVVDLYSELMIPWDVTLNFTAAGDTELYWALIPANPVNVSAPSALPHEIGVYIDVYSNDTSGVGPVTMTFEYDEVLLNSFGIDETDLIPLGFNQTMGEWGFAPSNTYTIDTVNNLLEVTLPELFFSLFTIGMNYTSKVEWSVDVSDEIFYGQNGHEHRAVITAISETLRALFSWDPMSPIEMFSEVYADLYYWDMMSEGWHLRGTSILVAAANNHWPFAPYYMQMTNTEGPPLLYPMGTTGFDFQPLFIMYQDMFDNITLGHDRTEVYNSSSGDFDITFLDVASGIPFFKIGKRDMPSSMGSEFYSFYRKIRAPLIMGNNHLTLQADLVPDLAFSADITAINGGVDFLFAILPTSPVHMDIPRGTLLFYSDVMITDHTAVSQIEMTVTLPPSISVDAIELILYSWANATDYGGRFGYWDAMPEEDMNNSVVYDVDTNSIILTFEVNDPLAGVFAWAFILSSEELPEIPGYDLLIILGFLGVTSGIIINRRRKLMDK